MAFIPFAVDGGTSPVADAIQETQAAETDFLGDIGNLLATGFNRVAQVGIDFGVAELGRKLSGDNDDEERREHTGTQPNQPRPATTFQTLTNSVSLPLIAIGGLIFGIITFGVVRLAR